MPAQRSGSVTRMFAIETSTLRRVTSTLLALCVAAAWVGSSRGQTNGEESDSGSPAAGEFHFARMIYQDRAGYGGGFFRRGRGRGWWQQDWPAADTHFTQAIRRLTRI